jgi:putative nucleotidyltransferase with HDIG domain
VEQRIVKIATGDLKTGMFVQRLDRPWLETPFMFQGFLVDDPEVVRLVRQYCKTVWVDIDRGLRPELGAILEDSRQQLPKRDLIPPDRQQQYPDRVPMEEEYPAATQAYGRAQDVANSMLERLREGDRLDLPQVKDAVCEVVGSMTRNPDAMIWLNQLKRKDRYSYHHSLSVPVWAILLARHLGMPQPDIERLALGCLLLDIGKTRLPDGLLEKRRRLTQEEFELVKQHVDFGVELLQQQPGIDMQLVYIVRSHHERHDGTGYPRGLAGTRIPLMGRIAAIADCYDAITSSRPYAEPMPHFEAVGQLYQWRNMDFQAELVEQFIQAMGIYPTGSMVELSSGEVGVVIQQSRVERLRPRVMLVLDGNKQPLAEYVSVDLITQREDGSGRPLAIKRGLDAGDFGIDPEELFL